jgi:hypothetical protein
MGNKKFTQNKRSKNAIKRQQMDQENVKEVSDSQMAVNGKRKRGIF